ncbi:MAG: hypothetical protein WBA53_18510 [Burkholderiaceae bacterium]
MKLVRPSIENASWRLRSVVEKLGPVGGIGVALLFGCAVFFVAAVVPVEDELTSLQEQRVAEDLARRSGRPVVDTASQLNQFMTFFPTSDSTSQWLGLVYAAASKEGLELAQGTYKVRGESGVGLMAYQVTLPVRGGYPQIRRFVGRVLSDVPAASLESISFQRERSADGAVDAKVVFTLHLRETAGQKPAAPRDEGSAFKQEADAGEGVLARAEVKR